uniref:RecD helicase /ATP-dependent exoDNAse n=1 Tax=Pithovirus LCPAC102 TaxID=2506587 RepID=A0A481Z625_9VIRU|nr:MAG: RecD helicase /ATP-dependent exoDNAse [Pithovirus LCPAC102]
MSKAKIISNTSNESYSDIIEEVKLNMEYIGKKIIGRVDKMEYKQKICIIREKDTMELFKCKYNYFFSARPGDSIRAYILKDTNNYTFEKHPYVILSIDDETMVKCIMTGRPRKTNKSLAEEYLRYLNSLRLNIRNDEMETDNILLERTDNTNMFISHFAIKYSQRKLSSDKISLLTNDGAYMREDEMKKFLFWWNKQRVLRRLYLFGLTNTEINESNLDMDPIDIYNTINDNPFKVLSLPIIKCKTIYNILNKKYTNDDIMRAEMARLIFDNLISRGWTCTPNWFLIKLCDELCDKRKDPLSKNDRIKTYVSKMIQEYGMISENHNTYTKLSNKVENYLCDIFMSLIQKNNKDKNTYTPTYTVTLDDKQKECVSTALNSNICIITGGAGTGKTTIIRQIIENLDRLGSIYAVVSFTGKAVSRLKEVIGNDSPATMHMMINKVNTKDKIKWLIIDEISMVTSKLLYDFFIAYGVDLNVILVGDMNQLSPISWGNAFSEVMKTRLIPTIKLTKNYRSGIFGDNGIILNTNAILKYSYNIDSVAPGEHIEDLIIKKYDNFCLYNGGTIDNVIEIINELANAGIKSTEVTVITPFKKDIKEINYRTQSIFDLNGIYNNGVMIDDAESNIKTKDKFIQDDKGYKWCIGDRVIMLNNNYDIGIMNGDEGVIIDLVKSYEQIIYDNNIKSSIRNPCNVNEDEFIPKILIRFRSGKEYEFLVTYDKLEEETEGNTYNSALEGENNITNKKSTTVESLMHAYCMTIHRSQGSEWDFIILYFPESNGTKFLNMNLLYTALTRGRCAVWCVGDIHGLTQACMRRPAIKYDTLGLKMLKAYQTILEK